VIARAHLRTHRTADEADTSQSRIRQAPSTDIATRDELAIEVLRLRRIVVARNEQVRRLRRRVYELEALLGIIPRCAPPPPKPPRSEPEDRSRPGDVVPVDATKQELRNVQAREVVRRIYNERKALGLCVRCKAPQVPERAGKVLCRPCTVRDMQRDADRRARNRSSVA
jgi:hypothetical protein